MDPKIEDLVTRIENLFRETYAVLALRPTAAYAEQTAALDGERQRLQEEDAALQEAARNLADILPAKARVAQAEHDRLLLAGDRKGAAEKLSEQKQAEEAPARMTARQREIAGRIVEIDGEKRAIAMRIFEGWHGECRQIVGACEKGFFGLLDALRQSFLDFERPTYTEPGMPAQGFVKEHHLSNLTAPENSVEWGIARQWYGGRRT
jgi:hypothetical protein